MSEQDGSAYPTGEVDWPIAEFRAAMHRVADLAADYLDHAHEYPVVPRIAPGDIRRRIAAAPPLNGEPADALLADFKSLIEPNVTHWNHPGFMAYFAITGSAPGILAEALTAALNVNAMLWRTGPAATELEEACCDWLRQMLDLPPEFRGHINDTASIASMLAIAAARQQQRDLNIRQHGMAGRSDVPALTVYCSEHAHSSIDKAMITLGLGLSNLRKIPTDKNYCMLPAELAAAVAADRAASRRPIAIVATAGTTSVASVDPLREIAAIAGREKIWFHVDAAYAGSAAICPEFRKLLDGLELADSIVVNPHKWLFTPVDCSVLLTRDPATLKEAFTLVPEYLRTSETEATNLMDYGPQLGRRFRALKLWFVMRAFGVAGLQARIRRHCALAAEFCAWLRADPRFEIAAPVHFSTVCFRRTDSGLSIQELNQRNEAILNRVNADGRVFLSHTKLEDCFVIRLTIGNLRTERRHVETAFRLVQDATDAVDRGLL